MSRLPLDDLKVLVECREGVSEAERAAAATTLRARVKEIVGVSITAEVVEPGAIPRSAGKAQRVRDLR